MACFCRICSVKVYELFYLVKLLMLIVFSFIHIVYVDLYMMPNMYTSGIRHIGTITNNPNNRYFSMAMSIIVPRGENAVKQQIKLLVVWIIIQGQSVFVL